MMILKIGLVTFFIYVVHSKVILFDTKIVPEHCQKARAIKSNYIPKGDVTLVGDLPVYEAPTAKTSPRMVIAIYDIFGFSNNNLKQVTDKFSLESGGFRVILPDFFRGQFYDPENLRNETMDDFMVRLGDWETRVKPDLVNLIETYIHRGVREFSIIGFCWGGKVAEEASIELAFNFKAAGLVHPAGVLNEEAPLVDVPMYLMPSQNEPDMLPFFEVLQEKFGNDCGHRRFNDMMHGFAGARGNFSDPINVARVEEVIATLGAFFNRNMPLKKF